MAKSAATFEPRAAQSRQATESPVAAESPDLPGRMRAIVSRNEGLADAKERLRDLEARKAVKQSALDQLKAEIGNPDLARMADQIAAGEELNEHQAMFVRRDALTQQLAAFAIAIQRAQLDVTNAMKLASAEVCDELRSEFAGKSEEFLRHADAMRTSFEKMQGFHQAAAATGVHLDQSFVIWEQFGINQVMTKLKSSTTEWRRLAAME